MSRHLDFDPVMRTKHTFHEEGDEYVVDSAHDVTEIIEANKASMAVHDEHERWGDISRVASIPMALYMQLQKEGIVDDEKAFKRWLNDPENWYFRTRFGRV